MIIEYLIILLVLAILISIIVLFYRTGLLRRKVEVIIVENLPLGIFKDNNVNVQEKSVNISIQENARCIEDTFDEEFVTEPLEEDTSCIENEDIVYWTPNGKHYHSTQNCKTLLRSKVINSGSINESGKLSSCHRCNLIR